MANAIKSGFYATDNETFYVHTDGRIFYSSVDFDGIKEVAEMSPAASPVDELMTPDEQAGFITQIEEYLGEPLSD